MHLLLEEIARLNAALQGLNYGPEVACVYNPLEYAIEPHRIYLERFGTGTKRVVFLGMNPGPYGMVQTGVPFGEIEMVRDWMGIQAAVHQPEQVHPKRPILGFECNKSEVSGKRLWGMIADRFPNPDDFFKDCIVVNYCPLVWMMETGKNITPDKLPKVVMSPVYQACDAHLVAVLKYYQPDILVGVGAFAEKQLKRIAPLVLDKGGLDKGITIGRMLHPSPASPIANAHWPQKAIEDLQKIGVW